MSVRQSPRRLVAVLALTETVSFGVLLYTFSVLLVPMERDLEASRGGLSAAIAIAALVRAFAAPVVGSIIDRFGVRRLMIGGSLAAVALVVAWSYVQNATQLIAVFVGIGIVLRRLSVYGVHNYTPADFVAGVDWLAKHNNTAPTLSNEIFPLERIDAAIAAAKARSAIRVVVSP